MPELTYLGHDAFLVKADKARLAIDPFLTGNPVAAAAAEDLNVDYVLITHGHGDHLGDGIEIAKRCGATIISTFEMAGYCQSRGAKAHPMHIGGGHDFDFGRVKLTIAHHGNTVETPDGPRALGPAAGIIVKADGRTLYHAGDTGLFYDMKLIGEMNPLDVALLPIGDNFTMGPDDAVKAAELLQAKLTIPMHYNTFDLIRQDPGDYVRRGRALGLGAEVLKVGATLTY